MALSGKGASGLALSMVAPVYTESQQQTNKYGDIHIGRKHEVIFDRGKGFIGPELGSECEVGTATVTGGPQRTGPSGVSRLGTECTRHDISLGKTMQRGGCVKRKF